MDPSLLGLFDFVGYPVGLGSPAGGGGGFGIPLEGLFFLYREEARRQRLAEARARAVELMLADHREAVYTRRYEQMRKTWAATYTTLLCEV